MRIFEADHKHYIRLGDLDHLLRKMCGEIDDGYSIDENDVYYQDDGTKGMTPEDQAARDILEEVITRILRGVDDSEDGFEEAQKLHQRIEREFYIGKYVVKMTFTCEDGKTRELYFQRYCTKALEYKWTKEGKSREEIEELLAEYCGEPTFCTCELDAMYFEDHETAESTSKFINKNCDLNTKVIPAFYLDREGAKMVLDKIMGEKVPTEAFHERLKKMLLENDMSTRECAKAIGVSEVRMGRFLNGEKKPNMSEILNLCKVFNCEPDDLGVKEE